MAASVQKVVPIRRMTRWPAWRQVAPGTGLPSPRTTSARIEMREEAMTERILAILKTGPVYTRETALRIGCGQRNVNYHLGKLRDRGQATHDPALQCWVFSENGRTREQAAREIEQLMKDLKPVLNRTMLLRLFGIRRLLRDPRHY